MIYYSEYESPLGQLLLATTARGLCGLYFEQHRHFRGKDEWELDPDHKHLRHAVRQLDEYFGGVRRAFDLTLDVEGTDFQKKVWNALYEIQYGRTSSYLKHAQLLGNSNAVRAVGSAIGRNPICIVIPCHRIIGSSGNLTGYAGGIERKQFLLSFEARSDLPSKQESHRIKPNQL